MRLHGGFSDGNVKPVATETERKRKRNSMSKRPRLSSPSNPQVKIEKFTPAMVPKPGMIIDVRKPMDNLHVLFCFVFSCRNRRKPSI